METPIGIRELARREYLEKALLRKKERKIPTFSDIVPTEAGQRVLLRLSEGRFSFCSGDRNQVFCNESCEGTTHYSVVEMDRFFASDGEVVNIPHMEGKRRTVLSFRKKRLLGACAKLAANDEANKSGKSPRKRTR